MGMIEKLKGITNWQTVVVICFYIGTVLAVTMVAVVYDITWLMAGGATTLGIVAGSLTGVARGAFTIPTAIPVMNTNSDTTKKELDDLRICLAETRNELLLLKSKIGENSVQTNSGNWKTIGENNG